jgi:heme/copper-type cytochrome/quinol oxidase subunit 2
VVDRHHLLELALTNEKLCSQMTIFVFKYYDEEYANLLNTMWLIAIIFLGVCSQMIIFVFRYHDEEHANLPDTMWLICHHLLELALTNE